MPEKINSALKNKPIGIFDSGFGGLTVMSAVNKILPNENLIYFGDTAHVPYGSKSKDAVVKFSKDIASFLIKKDIKLLVIACNTASAFALSVLKKSVSIPVVGVIEPGAKAAVKNAKNGRIGIIGTEGTVASGSYFKAVKKISGAAVFQQACPLFVPLVEEGWNKGKIAQDIIGVYLKPLLAKNIDALILGCTHYPLLKELLSKATGANVELIDSANAAALEVKEILLKKDMLSDAKKKASLKFYVSDNPKKFQKIGGKFFLKKINGVKKINLERICEV
ncbi:MAG: glutamate racemase [Endomicrobium sp.]|jgi:glutamate racemase|nr:glutamate racemase [Endomicrobium sp.]